MLMYFPFVIADSSMQTVFNGKTGIVFGSTNVGQVPGIYSISNIGQPPLSQPSVLPTFYEVGNGAYEAIYDPEQYGDAIMFMNAGNVVANSSDRYPRVVMTRESGRIIQGIPAAAPGGAGGLPTADASNRVAGVAGNVTGSVGSVTGAVGSVTAAVTVGTNQDKTGYGLTSGERAAITTAVLTDATGSNQAVPGSTGSMVAINNGIALLGTVNDTAPSINSCIISLAVGTLPADLRIQGLEINFTGALSPAKGTISQYQLLTSTTARVSFSPPLNVLPTNGAPFAIF